MAISWSSFSSTLQTAATNALIQAADIQILEAAAEYDEERDTQFTSIETTRQQEAQTLYYQQQKDQRLVKAALIPRTGEAASPINFMFNPTDLSLSRSVSTTLMSGARTQRGLPKVNFGFVEPYKLTLSGILFDTYETGETIFNKIQCLLDAVDFSKFKDPFQSETVNGYTYQERTVQLSSSETAMQSFVGTLGGKNVMGAREYGSENVGTQSLEIRRPPVFYFIWGEKNYMCCMVKQLDYKLTMFLPNGTPVRAMVNITLEEVDLGVASRAYSTRQKFIT